MNYEKFYKQLMPEIDINCSRFNLGGKRCLQDSEDIPWQGNVVIHCPHLENTSDFLTKGLSCFVLDDIENLIVCDTLENAIKHKDYNMFTFFNNQLTYHISDRKKAIFLYSGNNEGLFVELVEGLQND